MSDMIEVARATVTIIPNMKGAQETISEELGATVKVSGEKAGKTFGNGLKGGLAVAGTAFAAAGSAVAKLSSDFISGAKDVASYGDDIDKMSQKLGISAEAYQEWDFVLQHNGTSIDRMQGGFKTLSNKLSDTSIAISKWNDESLELNRQLNEGTISQEEFRKKTEEIDAQAEKSLGVFGELGFSLLDMTEMGDNTEEVFGEVIKKLQEMPEGAERAALANEVLGRSGQELGALLNTSAEETQEMLDKVHELSGVMSNDSVKAAAGFQDSLQDLGVSITGLKNNAIAEFLPAVTGVMDGLTMIFSGQDGGVAKITEGVGSIIDGLTAALPKIVDVGIEILDSLVQAIADNIPSIMNAATEIVMNLGEMIIENLPLLLEAGLEIIVALVEGIVENVDLIMDGILKLMMSLVEFILVNLPKIYEKGTEIVLSLIDGIVNALPKLIDGALDMLDQFLDAISENPEILLTGFNVVLDIIEGLIKALPKLLEAALRLITGIFDAFMKINWLDLGINIIKGLINGMLSMAGSLLDTAMDLAKTAWDGIKSFFGISSPAKLTVYGGAMVGEGLIDGIKEKEPELKNTVEDVGMIVKSGIDAEIQTIDAPTAGLGSLDIADALSGMKVVVNVVLKGDAGSLFEVVQQEAEIIGNMTRKGAFA